MICLDCNVDKNINEFHSNGKGGKRKQCKLCMNEINKKWRKDNKEHVLAHKRSQPRMEYRSFEHRLAISLTSARSYDRKFGLLNDLDVEYLMSILEKQEYRCAILGVKLAYQKDNLLSVSIDRIDSNHGHTKDNTQLVCLFAQFGKSNKSNAECQEVLRGIEMNILRKLKELGKLNFNS